MAKFDKETVARWTKMAKEFLDARDISITSIETGVTAWLVAHKCGITDEAYKDRTVTDGHIQTALEAIFPNAVFRDKKVY